MTALDQMVLPQANILLAFLGVRLTAQPNVPAQICLRVGDVAQDAGQDEDLCCSGLAWVRIVSVFPAGDDFPAPSTDFAINGCGVNGWGIVLEMGVLRCAPVGTVSRGPTCAEHTASAEQVADDDRAMRLAVCDLLSVKDPMTVSVGAWTPIGPLGGCVGGLRSVTVLVDECECV